MAVCGVPGGGGRQRPRCRPVGAPHLLCNAPGGAGGLWVTGWAPPVLEPLPEEEGPGECGSLCNEKSCCLGNEAHYWIGPSFVPRESRGGWRCLCSPWGARSPGQPPGHGEKGLGALGGPRAGSQCEPGRLVGGRADPAEGPGASPGVRAGSPASAGLRGPLKRVGPQTQPRV